MASALLVMRQRLFGAPEALQRVAEIAVRFGKVGLERERFLVAADRLIVAFQSGQRHREMKLRIGRARIDFHRAPEQEFRVGKAGLLQANEAEAIERVEVPAVSFENDAIALLRLLQMSLIVQHCGIAECLRNAEQIAPRMRRCGSTNSAMLTR